MDNLLIGMLYQGGWPWRRPKVGDSTMTDLRGGLWKHERTHWSWLEWRWVSTFVRAPDSATEER